MTQRSPDRLVLYCDRTQILRESLIQYIVDTRDYMVSDRFIELLRPRRLESA